MTTATKTPTQDERIAQRRAALTTKRAARKDALDLDRTLTMRQINEYAAETTRIDHEIAAFHTVVETWLAVPSVEPDTKWLAFLTASRDTISAERLAIKSPIRDRAVKERADRLEWAIRLIDHGLGISTIGPIISLASSRIGELMAAAGYDTVGLELLRGPNGFRGTLADTEQRIKILAKRRTDARAALDAVLLSDEERATQEAESAVLNAAFNAMHCKYRDGGYVAHTDDGDVLPVSEMTDIQKRAIERSDTLERAYRQSVIDRQAER